MGVHEVMSLSLGEWASIVTAWNKAQAGGKPDAPSEDEFDTAVMRARGVS